MVRIKDDACDLSCSPGGGTGGEVCRLRLHLVNVCIVNMDFELDSGLVDSMENPSERSSCPRVKEKEKERKSIYIAPFIYYVYLKALRHGSHSCTCKYRWRHP